MPKSPKRPEVPRCRSSSSLRRVTYSGGLHAAKLATLGRFQVRVGSASGFGVASDWTAQKILGRAVASEWIQQGGTDQKTGEWNQMPDHSRATGYLRACFTKD